MKEENIRLLHLIKTLNIGGIEKSTIEYSNVLVENFGYIGIFAKSAFYNHGNLVKNEIELIEFYKKISIINSISIFFLLKKIIQEKKITHLHYHHRIYLPIVFILTKLFPQLKIIYTHHSVFDDRRNKFLIADKFIAVSDAAKRDLLNSKKNIDVDVIYHGVKISNPHSIIFKGDVIQIGYIGRLDKCKGISILLESIKGLIEEKIKVKLLLKGSGSEEGSIKAFINKNELGNFVSIVENEWLENNLYSGIDLLVLPSIELEGFGLVLIEAMSYGIPVIGAELPVIAEIVENNQNGLLFTVGDSFSLKNRINELICNHDLINHLVKNAKITVSERFNFDQTIKNYQTFYKNI
jgi:glycosyltransferase involved in cell wall biosynthesis